MQASRTFLYVCVAILALVGAFHLGARAALSQTGPLAVLGGVGSTPSGNGTAVALDQAGDLWVWATGCGEPQGPFALPKSGKVVAANADANRCGEYWVLYEDGDLFHNNDLVTNLFRSGPIPTRPMTWGRIKSDRR